MKLEQQAAIITGLALLAGTIIGFLLLYCGG